MEEQLEQPYDDDIERAVLGILISYKNSTSEVVNLLKPESFYMDHNKMIYKAILRLFNSGNEIDMITVVNELRRKNQLDTIGGALEISQLANEGFGDTGLIYKALVVKENHMRRMGMKTGIQLYQAAADRSVDIFDSLDIAEKSLFNIQKINIMNNQSQQDIHVNDAVDNIEKSIKLSKEDKIIGIPSGLTSLDNQSYGFRDGELTILAARPSIGKTGLAMHIAKNCGVKIGIFSYESKARMLFYRMASGSCRILYEKFSKGTISEEELQKFKDFMEDAKLNIMINDDPKLTLPLVRSQAHKWVASGAKMLIFDYLQLIPIEMRSGTRETEVSAISRFLKNLTLELDIPVLALSQLSRATESASDRRPKLSHLRESGAIEQDADNVYLMYRPGYYDDKNSDFSEGYTEVICPKHRNGALFTAYLEYDMQYQRFSNHNTQTSSNKSDSNETIPF